MRQATDPRLHGMPGVPRHVPDFMQGESREHGVMVDVKGWHSWSDKRKLRWLRQFAERYAQDPAMNTFVAQRVLAAQGVAPRDYPAQAAAILRWVQSNIYYVNEPGEIVRSPWRTIKDRTGDCDDMAVLMATFAQTIGLPWRFVLAGKKGNKQVKYHEGGRWPWGAKMAHIYVQFGWPPFAENPKEWMDSPAMQWASAEPTVAGAPLGYDVVDHGFSSDANGAATLPEMAGLGNPETIGEALERVEPEKSKFSLRRIWNKLDWNVLAVEAIQGIFTAVAIGIFVPVITRALKRFTK